MELILASNSPRRKQLLTEYGFKFTVIPSEYEEVLTSTTPELTVKAFALGKANDVYQGLKAELKKNVAVLGADTVVAIDGEILGKPTCVEHARQMLKRLSGREHFVYTGYCMITGDVVLTECERSSVYFNQLSDELINSYVATGKPMDKAGAYGIQDDFGLVKGYDGSFNNIVGLPVEKFKDKLAELLKQ